MVTKYMFDRVRALSAQGMGIRGISRELGIDRKTVSRYLTSNSPPQYKERQASTRIDPCKEFMEEIKSMLSISAEARAFDIFVLLQDRGYRGSLRTLERRVAAIRGEQSKERFFAQEYEPGEQAQFDFKEKLSLPFIDGERIVHFLYGTFPYSDFFSVKAFPNKAFEAFMEGVHSFFEAAGGMSKKIRFDNLSPCVKKVLKGDKRIYTERFQKALKYYDLGDLPCAPGKGSDKGDVEREIRTQTRRIRERIKLTGKVFIDFSDLNLWLLEQCQRAMTPTIQKKYEEERNHLKTLPRREPSILCQIHFTKASSFGTININKSTYSVPDSLIGVNCKLVLDAYRLQIFRAGHNRKAVVEFPRIESGEHKLELAHVLPSLVRKPQAMVRWAHKEVLFPSLSCQRFYDFLGHLNPESQERDYLKTLNLIQYVTLTEIELAMNIVRRSKSKAPFDDAKLLLLCPQGIPQSFEQTPLKPSLAVYDEFIPNNLEDSA